jgi:hypothetical protein
MQKTLKDKRVAAILAFALAVFLLAGICLVSCHHHADAVEHVDCSICAAAHQITSLHFCYYALSVFVTIVFSTLSGESALFPTTFFSGISGRAPPVCF